MQGLFCYLENESVLGQQENHIVAGHQGSDCFISVLVARSVELILLLGFLVLAEAHCANQVGLLFY